MKKEDIESLETEYPWQDTPTKLIMYAIELAENGGEFLRHIAFLLLDVGIETIFKTFLSIDINISKSKISYNEAKDIVDSGSFFKLLKGIEKASKGRLEDNILERVLYFHSIRNKMYHQGDGVTVTEKNLADYSCIAEDLLDELLDVNLRPEPKDYTSGELVNIPYSEESEKQRLSDDVLTEIRKLSSSIIAAIGFLKPAWGSPDFVDEYEQIWDEYPDDDLDHHRTRTEYQEKRGELFRQLTKIPETAPDRIDMFLTNRMLLYLSYILDSIHVEDPHEHLMRYRYYREFAQNGNVIRPDDGRWNIVFRPSIEAVKEHYLEIVIWITEMKEKIQSIFS